MKTSLLLYGIGGGLTATAAGAGVATGIILPKALEAKNGLEAFVANGGGSNSLANKEHINYVALGDSETAGYVGSLGRDYRSYSDFLASSLKNSQKLGSYHNLAVSGERLADINKDIFENGDKVRVLKDADLITLTLGANDVLAYLKILNIPFSQAFGFIGDKAALGKVADNVAALDKTTPDAPIIKVAADLHTAQSGDVKDANDILQTFKPMASYAAGTQAAADRTELFGNNPNLGVKKEDARDTYKDTLSSLTKLINGDKGALFNIDKD